MNRSLFRVLGCSIRKRARRALGDLLVEGERIAAVGGDPRPRRAMPRR